ncbi:MAG: sigma-70 family RNA polymerase sigma factor [Ignavibacteriales bacterium]|nr:MAG: sigma-70 family RNA polymerase sigma factor [Ignavibacteriales bacterium]
MQKINDGDIEAIKNLYERYSALLYTLIKKILKDENHSEDVLSRVFLMILKEADYYDVKSGNTYTWLVSLTKNIAVYELRKKEGRVDKNLSLELEAEYVLPKLSRLSESLELDKAVGLKTKIETALNKLTDAQQYVIYLAYYEGLNQQDIAKKLKIPHSTVESKIKTSLINLNENFIGKPSLFTVKNEMVELIYPFVLGCIDYESYLRTYNSFKASEPFPWKLLGEYQNLVSLLPVILELEYPKESMKEKVFNRIYHQISLKENKTKTFERISSTSSRLKISEENEDDHEAEIVEALPSSTGETTETFAEEEIAEREPKKKPDDFEPVVPFKPSAKEIPSRRSSYSTIIIIGLIVLFVISAVLAYLFYNDRILYYESQVENLNQRISTITEDFQNHPEIPGLGELKNPKTIELISSEGTITSGEIILSYPDKRGYLRVNNLPILSSDNAYQLWGSFNGDFISLGVFKISARPDYYPFTLPDFVSSGLVEFYLIESNAAGSRRPGSKIYLQGKAE